MSVMKDTSNIDYAVYGSCHFSNSSPLNRCECEYFGPIVRALQIFQCLHVTYQGSNMCAYISTVFHITRVCQCARDCVFKDISWHRRSLQDISPIPKEMRVPAAKKDTLLS